MVRAALITAAILLVACTDASTQTRPRGTVGLADCRAPAIEAPALCGTHEVWENRSARAGRRVPLDREVPRVMVARDADWYIGGRPLNSWPAFLPPVLVAAALWSGLATLIAMLYLAGLPKWHDPLFDIRQIDRATYDRFFLLVGERQGSDGEIRRILQELGAEAVEELPA